MAPVEYDTNLTKGMDSGGVAIVPLGLPGVSKGKPRDKLGQRALNQGTEKLLEKVLQSEQEYIL